MDIKCMEQCRSKIVNEWPGLNWISGGWHTDTTSGQTHMEFLARIPIVNWIVTVSVDDYEMLSERYSVQVHSQDDMPLFGLLNNREIAAVSEARLEVARRLSVALDGCKS